jgi:putative ABC transport system permease protein
VRVLRLAPAEAMRPESPARFRPGPLERLGLQRFIPLATRIVLRNLERRPLKALLSILGLALAVALLVTGQFTFDALDELIRIQYRVAQRDDVSVTFNEVRDMSVRYELAAMPGVLRVEPYRAAAAELQVRHRRKKTAIMGLVPQRELRLVLDADERPIELPPEGIVLSAKLAEMLDVRTGEAATIRLLEGQRRTVDTKVSRIIDEPIGAFAYMDNAALARLMSEPETASGAYLAVDPRRQADLYRVLKKTPAIGSVALREATLASFLSTVVENMRINTTVLIGFACIIAMGIVYNSARISLSEHAIELASLRILGFTRTEVGAMLLGEQGLLTLCALPLGCALGFGLAALISIALEQELYRIPLVVSSRTYLLSIGVVLGAAAISGLLVWRKVKHLDLIEVLKTRE